MTRDMDLKRQRDRERHQRLRDAGLRKPEGMSHEQVERRRERFARAQQWRTFMARYRRMCADPGLAVAGIAYLDRTEPGWRDEA